MQLLDKKRTCVARARPPASAKLAVIEIVIMSEFNLVTYRPG
jgi:hypothetical protein